MSKGMQSQVSRLIRERTNSKRQGVRWDLKIAQTDGNQKVVETQRGTCHLHSAPSSYDYGFSGDGRLKQLRRIHSWH
jgi:hypothetical protein